MNAQLFLTPLLGATVGSFLNVVAYRLPRGLSVARPRSRCSSCGHPIKPYDNVPVLSWILLRGRCRQCKAPISARYPLVEAVTAALWALVVVVKGLDPDALLGLAFVTLLVPVTLIDLDHRIIPNKLLLVATPVGLAILVATDLAGLPEHLIAAVAAGGFLLLAAIASPGGMGMGDVKLAGVMGLYLGASVGPAMLVALLTGTLVGAAIIMKKGAKAGRKTAVPFGPFLALGGVVGLLAGPQIIDWYLRTF